MKKGFSINNMSVKAKITMFSGVMLLFMVIIAGVGLYASNKINKDRSNRYAHYAMGQFYLSEAYSDFADIKVRLRNAIFVYPEDEANLQDQETKMKNFEAAMKESFQKFEDIIDLGVYPSEIEPQYDKVMGYCDDWLVDGYDDIRLVKEGNVAQAEHELMENGMVMADNLEKELDTLVSLLEETSAADNKKLETELNVMIIILVAVAVIAFIITFAYAMLLIRLITVPVAKLSEAAKKMAIGDIDVDCTKLADDDLGELMENFAEMAAATKEQARIADVMASGDMTVNVHPRSEKDVLGKALQKLATDSNRTLSSVKESTMQVTIGAEQVASASQALAQGSTEQASALQQVTASINEIAENTKKNATEATTANNLVNEANNLAEDGKSSMQSMMVAMQEIGESSDAINKIIKTIDDIAFQTNILALNAAVEAARAGAHGKGFAVVAEEVRNLAAKSASAAKETAEMIEDTINKVNNGQKLADETSDALNKIVGSIEEVNVLIGNIAASSNDQATAVSQIDQAINQVSTVVQTNSATSEECAAASEELSNQAVNLRNQMAGYTLAGGSNGGSSFQNSSQGSFTAPSGGSNEQIISLDGEFGKY